VIGTQEKLPGVVPALTVSNHEIPEASSQVWAAINVDIAWDESWIGNEQVRSFRIDGDRLHIEAAPPTLC
jgi:hypothetical protein